ncbi:hypothetical protein [Mesorhizobium sp.]|uniref:GAP1-N1 domain-containing protein n=1 Tax=Mesorhizobium sp. TaxID=1871066 RepID=UPI000FE76689|nr:hypothetical protein [Mesorhizobium sp.]RWP76620.1 MAG: hypothetical protein EOR09_10765 [Mesorhizobium sp.]
MTSGETNEVGQAVFGYSNGHRLLTSTLPLSAIDIYELAAASDLAPGAQISGDSSYLTGLSLPDSKLYALIRTWLAPEMPRPGCVWSHVLLLDHTLMATQIDLAVLADLHRRPDEYAADTGFSVPIALNRRLRAGKADRQETEKVLLACYTDLSLDEAHEDRARLERAILAVWSQQWPRLRRQFTFRSTSTTSDLKGQFLRLKRGTPPSANLSSSPPWLEDAAIDATAQTVTPLRRFLWRYGKDISSDRTVLPELIQLYGATRFDALGYDVADMILTRFSPGQADTLKKDVLGLSPSKLSLVPSVNGVDLMRLLAKHKNSHVGYERAELTSIFSRMDAEHLVELSAALMISREKLGDMFELVFEAILPILGTQTVEDVETPVGFALLAVANRTELLTPAVIGRLSNEDLKHLWTLDLTLEQRRQVIRAVMQRSLGDTFADLALSEPSQTLHDAIALNSTSQLHDSWLRLFKDNVSAFVDVVAQLASGDDLISAAHLLGYPVEPESVVRPWFLAFKNNRSTLSHDDETRVLVYLLALSIRYGIENYRDILVEILDRLRYRVLHSDLPSDAEDRLSKCLPSDDARWDLNKRVLKLFRKAYKRGYQLDEVLVTLNLTDDEYAYATDQDPDDMVRRFWRAFNPWSHLD